LFETAIAMDAMQAGQSLALLEIHAPLCLHTFWPARNPPLHFVNNSQQQAAADGLE
jgi:hypothetical protein